MYKGESHMLWAEINYELTFFFSYVNLDKLFSPFLSSTSLFISNIYN